MPGRTRVSARARDGTRSPPREAPPEPPAHEQGRGGSTRPRALRRERGGSTSPPPLGDRDRTGLLRAGARPQRDRDLPRECAGTPPRRPEGGPLDDGRWRTRVFLLEPASPNILDPRGCRDKAG